MHGQNPKCLLGLMVTILATTIHTLNLPTLPTPSRDISPPPNHTIHVSASPIPTQTHPIDCFNPYSTTLQRTSAEDCDFIINEIILRYPHPMAEQTWGYSDYVDIDLRLRENNIWHYGRCAIFVRSQVRAHPDRFRVVDVAVTAARIVKECVHGSRYPLGGTASVGSESDNFYVGLGGVIVPELGVGNRTEGALRADG
ncbi:hypothetical protein ACLMJK_003009 [Lecanora helva]